MSVMKLRVRRPIYPVLAVAAALMILFTGLFLSGGNLFLWFLIALCLLYLSFGYGPIVCKFLLIFIPVGIVTGSISILAKGDWDVALRTVGRLVLLGLSSVTLITTPPVNLTRSLTELRVPRALTLGMLITIRFIPILAEETRRIREAMRTRGVNMAWYNLKCLYRALLIPFILRLLSISDTLAVSVETRGFELSRTDATVYRPVRPSWRDGIFAALLLALCAGMAVMTV